MKQIRSGTATRSHDWTTRPEKSRRLRRSRATFSGGFSTFTCSQQFPDFCLNELFPAHCTSVINTVLAERLKIIYLYRL